MSAAIQADALRVAPVSRRRASRTPAVLPAGNAYLTALYEGVHTAVLAREYEHWVRTETEPTWLAPPAVPLLDLHRAIYDAVAAGDAEAARVAVQRHHQVMLEHLAAAPGMPPTA